MDIPLTRRTQALILRYEHDRPIAENTAREALKHGGFEGDRDVASLVLHPFDEANRVRAQREQDWSWAFDENERFAEALLKREQELGLDLPIHLFGCAPLGLMLHLGWCLSRRPLYVYQQAKDGSWSLAHDRSQPASREDFFHVEGLPAARQGGRGQVVLIVEVTKSIRDTVLADFEARYSSELLTTVTLRPVRGPSEQAVQDPGEVSRAAEQFRVVLDTLHDRLDGAESVLLAMDCPGGFAAALGTAVNVNTQHPLGLHHYDPEQRKYLAVHRIRHRRRLASTPATAITGELLEELKKVRVVHERLVEWLREPGQAHLLERLGGTALLESEIDTTPATETTPLFRYHAGSWKFHVDLLMGFRALRQRLGSTEDWEECIRLFLVHEAFHVQQGGPTSYGYSGSGRAGWVLEVVDYDADVVAVEVALEWRRKHRPETTRFPASALEAISWNILENLRVFEQERPVRDLSERRLRRYLIWLFHACRFGTRTVSKESNPELARVVIEVVGLTSFPDPYERYRQTRVRLEGLDKHADLALALYYGRRLVREQEPTWVCDLLRTFSRWDELPRESVQNEMKLHFERLFDRHRFLLAPTSSPD